MEEMLAKIHDLYGIDAQWSERVTKGFLSENHIISDIGDQKKYFLKRYRFDNKQRIEEIHLVKKYFAEKGIPIILPITNKEGGALFFHEGYFAVFPFVEGRHIERNALSDEAIISLGETLARIHLAGKGANLPIMETFEPWDKEKQLAKSDLLIATIQQRSQLTDFDKLALEDIHLRRSIIESNIKSFEEYGFKSDHLTHGDYHGGNVFFDERDHVSHIFDLEKSRYCPRMFELFRSLLFLFCDTSFTPESIAKSRLYLRSYLNLYPAPKEELSAGLEMFFLRFVHGFWVQNEHYLKGNTRVDHFLSQDFHRITYMSAHLKELEKELFE